MLLKPPQKKMIIMLNKKFINVIIKMRICVNEVMA